jgi:hypothetical protein
MRRLLGLAVAAVIAGLMASAAASADNTGFRIIDRTLICPMIGVGYPDSVRFMTAGGRAFREDVAADGVRYTDSASISVWNGGTAPDSGVSAGVRAGPAPGHATGALWFPRTRCRRTKIRVPLSSGGLTGGPADPSGEYYRCDAPATVLIRVRAVFKRPTALSFSPRAPYQSAARGPIATASLAIAALPGRKPIFFGSVDDRTGGARVFAALSRCKVEP